MASHTLNGVFFLVNGTSLAVYSFARSESTRFDEISFKEGKHPKFGNKIMTLEKDEHLSCGYFLDDDDKLFAISNEQKKVFIYDRADPKPLKALDLWEFFECPENNPDTSRPVAKPIELGKSQA